MSQTNEDIIRRVRALMEKTTANGCSEAEAMAASEMVSRLMNKYQLDLTDIKLKETANCREAASSGGQKNDPPSFMCANAIAHLTDTRVWRRNDRNGFAEIVFFGLETDVVVANYIWSIVDRAMLWAWLDYKATAGYKALSTAGRRDMNNSFHQGMASRINDRLRAMKKAQKAENLATTGRDLVIVKSAIVDAEFEKLGMTFGRAKSYGKSAGDGRAYAAGQDAGSRVALNPGVGAGAPQGSIK